ncbi:MAG: phosphatase [Kofleriaceae bacterium]|nr:phosphatase [Kofleriaceae bacterium]
MRFELHCHSTCSDGTEAPSAVASRAAERGVAVFALTDHDTCAGTAAAVVAGAQTLRAVEISCEEPATGRTIHLLAYDRGGAAWAALEAKLDEVRQARLNRMRMMGARLAQRGIRIDVEPMIEDAARSGRTLGRPDLARAMVAAGAASSFKDAFARHLYDGGPVDVPNRALTLPEALALGRAANAAMSLAHPHLYDHLGVQLCKQHVADGLGGVEAFYAGYDPRERARWIELADALGLVCTGGSDWHGPEDASAQPGVDLPDARSDALYAWLFSSSRR